MGRSATGGDLDLDWSGGGWLDAASANMPGMKM